ncbi:hypothetical protein E2P47_03840 [Candidatus Bathyarchaeota archaeon]|nr:hypothetical protein E2P47_03840 [Candidatus Bathyarchaeota archaeon]
MFSSLKGKIAFSGFAVLVIGITLLLFTFFSAYGFLTAGISPISTQDLIQTFGEALGPLIAAAVQIMFLGVMGWIGSLITLRGVAIIGITKNPPIIQQKSAIKEINQPQTQQTKQEPQINDPEMIVMPLEQVEQKSQSRKKNKRSK